MAYQANTSSYTIESFNTGVAGSSANTSSYTFDAGTSASAGAVNGSTSSYSFTGGTTVMYCGDGNCNNDETTSSCAIDCGAAADEESSSSSSSSALSGGGRSGGIADEEEDEEEPKPPRKRKKIKEIIEEDIKPVIDKVKSRTAELIYGPEGSSFSWSYFVVLMIVIAALIGSAWFTKKKVSAKKKS